MIKQVNIIKCDKCKKTVNYLYKFNIQYKIIDAICESKEPSKTNYLEYCKNCFSKMLENLKLQDKRIEHIQENKEDEKCQNM